MLMHRRHYEWFAAAIKEFQEGDSYASELAGFMADRLEDTNDAFDRNRFLDACEPEEVDYDYEWSDLVDDGYGDVSEDDEWDGFYDEEDEDWDDEE